MSELDNAIKRLREHADNKELPYIIADIIKKNCNQDEINLILQHLESKEKEKNITFIDARETDPKLLNKLVTDGYNKASVLKPGVEVIEPEDKYYRVFIRQYSIAYNDYLCYVKLIKTDDLYHWIGYYYSTALEHVRRIDYQEIDEETFKKEKPRTYYKGELI